MRGNIRGSWREPVEVQDLSIDLVLSQNLNTHSFTQIGFLLIFYDEEIYNIQYSECFFKKVELKYTWCMWTQGLEYTYTMWMERL